MFNEFIFRDNKAAITTAILEQIKKDRAGDSVQKDVIKKSIQVFVDIGLVKPKAMRTKEGQFLWQGDRNLSIYDDHFQSDFLSATKRESQQSATIWNSNRNCPEYLSEVKKALENEEANADYWL